MQCSNIRELTLEYALGDLRPAARLCVDVHTAHCPACRKELEDACELAAACERALAHPRPVDNFELLMARIASREAPPRERYDYARLARRALAARAAAVAAVAAVAALTVPAMREAGAVVRDLHHIASGRFMDAEMPAEAPPEGGPIARRMFEIEREFAAISPAARAPSLDAMQP